MMGGKMLEKIFAIKVDKEEAQKYGMNSQEGDVGNLNLLSLKKAVQSRYKYQIFTLREHQINLKNV